MKHKQRVPSQMFAETRMGIVTRYGDWFHVTTDQIKEHYPGLLEEVTLEEMVKASQAWVKSADSVAMILLLLLLVLIPVSWAVAIVLLFHTFWYFNKSSLVLLSLKGPLELLYKDGTQLVASLAVLSYLGMFGSLLAAAIGLLLFFVFKLGLLRRVWDWIYRKSSSNMLTLNDRVMKMVILRYAMRHDRAPDEIARMEEQIMELTRSRKNKRQ